MDRKEFESIKSRYTNLEESLEKVLSAAHLWEAYNGPYEDICAALDTVQIYAEERGLIAPRGDIETDGTEERSWKFSKVGKKSDADFKLSEETIAEEFNYIK